MAGHLSTFPLNFVVVAIVLRFFFSCFFFPFVEHFATNGHCLEAATHKWTRGGAAYARASQNFIIVLIRLQDRRCIFSSLPPDRLNHYDAIKRT